MREIFQDCGKINYISLPRFKGTPDRKFKGFAFIEFDDEASASLAVRSKNEYEAENNPEACDNYYIFYVICLYIFMSFLYLLYNFTVYMYIANVSIYIYICNNKLLF